MDYQMADKPYELLQELFIEPFMEQLFEQYPDKCYENKDIVIALLKNIEYPKIYTTIIEAIDPTLTFTRKNKTLNALESLYKVWHSKIDLTKIFGNNVPEPYKLLDFYRKLFPSMVEQYYGSTPPKQNTNIDKDVIRVSVKKLSDLAIDTSGNNIVTTILSLRVCQLKRYINDPYTSNLPRNASYANFSNCFFSGTDLRDKLITSFCFAGSSFRETKFRGDGSTGTCIHIDARDCDFTDAEFEGNICNKTSTYDGSNFTRVNLTPLMYNCGEVSMKNCNFTDAYVVDKENNKLMGKDLIRYLKEDKQLPIDGYNYSSPKDTDYDSDELDSQIWISI